MADIWRFSMQMPDFVILFMRIYMPPPITPKTYLQIN